MKTQKWNAHQLVFTAVMAALIFILTNIYVPLGQSKVHLGNTGSILAGLLLGPWLGGLASGIGAFLFDLLHGYGLIEALVTLVSKFAMAAVAGAIARAHREEGMLLRGRATARLALGSVAGGVTYVALYMLKTLVKTRFFSGQAVAWEGVFAAMLGKLPATTINNVFAAIVAPLFYLALRPALEKTHLLEKLA